jgi:hypothetical protein
MLTMTDNTQAITITLPDGAQLLCGAELWADSDLRNQAPDFATHQETQQRLLARLNVSSVAVLS